MKSLNCILLVLVLISTIAYAQVEIDHKLEMTGTYPDNNITGVGTIDVEVGYKFNGSVGTAGQLLRSNGSTGFVPATLSAGDIPAGSGHYIQNQTAANQSAGFRINGDGLFTGGNVGIGTTNPSSDLDVIGENLIIGNFQRDVTGGQSGGIRFGNNSQQYELFGNSSRTLLRAQGGNNLMYWGENGNVGIGTTSPSEKLEIDGNLRISGGNRSIIIDNNRRLGVFAADGFEILSFRDDVAGDNHPGVRSFATRDRTTGASPNVYITGAGNFSRSTSSKRYKKDIIDIERSEYNQILNLRPVKYRQIDDKDGASKDGIYYGLIAEEVAEISTRLVEWNFEEGGIPESVFYDRLSVLLLPVVKDLSNTVKEQQDIIETQAETMKIMQEQIQKMNLKINR